MSDSIIHSQPIHWPDGIDEGVFLADYWQQKPLLIRQAFPDFATPLPADELAGLSLEEHTNGRIITCDEQGAYALEHGPFDEERFATLTGNDWSLLVTDIEKHIPQLATWLQPFRFIPDWRIDDLMISYAPDGASVGAHVDEYDVFLLQGSGIRRWSIDARPDMIHQMRSDGDLKILANFEPTEQWDLTAGDMLYLPPGMAHHGIAKGDECTTWSIGFRAPLLSDLVVQIAELLSSRLQHKRYTDGVLTQARPGEISSDSVARFKAIWATATQLDNSEFQHLLGSYLTQTDMSVPGLSDAATDSELATAAIGVGGSVDYLEFQKSPFSRFAWISTSTEAALLFVDGTGFDCSAEFAQHLCESLQSVKLNPDRLDQLERHLLQSLIDNSSLSVEP